MLSDVVEQSLVVDGPRVLIENLDPIEELDINKVGKRPTQVLDEGCQPSVDGLSVAGDLRPVKRLGVHLDTSEGLCLVDAHTTVLVSQGALDCKTDQSCFFCCVEEVGGVDVQCELRHGCLTSYVYVETILSTYLWIVNFISCLYVPLGSIGVQLCSGIALLITKAETHMNRRPKRSLLQGAGAILLAATFIATSAVGASAAPVPASDTTACTNMRTDILQSANPTSNASLMTPWSDEINSAKTKNGFTQQNGAVFKASTAAKDGLSPIYRLHNGKTGDFLWLPKLASSNEYSDAQSKYGYTSQKIDFYASIKSVACGVPVERYLKGSMHRYASTQKAKDALIKSGWSNEGVKFWAVSATQESTDPANWVRWENVAEPGENINQVLQDPKLDGKILKLPKGVFEVSNFMDASKAIEVPSDVKGVIGSGNDTILRIKPNTSTYASTVPKQGTGATNQLYVIRMNNGAGTGPQVLSDMWVQGTEQGHFYNGIMVGKADNGTTVKNLLITGMPGGAGSPPGETFGLNWWKTNGSITQNIEVDGYRWTGDSFADRVKGDKVAASPIGYNDANNGKLYDAYTHDSKFGMPTFWQSNNNETWNLQSINNNAGINHEESFGTIHHSPVITGTANRQHISFMAAHGDGKLTIIGATVDSWTGTSKAGPVTKNGKLLILTPQNYTGKDTNTITTPPVVVQDDGVTKVPYTWAH